MYVGCWLVDYDIESKCMQCKLIQLVCVLPSNLLKDLQQAHKSPPYTFGIVQLVRDCTSDESLKLSFIFFQVFTKLIYVPDKFYNIINVF
jgi:hypothetical protein